nr:immunoglobulin heavy chain junction region [Mus musculus]
CARGGYGNYVMAMDYW